MKNKEAELKEKKKSNKRVELELTTLSESTFTGVVRRITGKPADRLKMQDDVWNELKEDGTLAKLSALNNGSIKGFAAVCRNFDKKGFDYCIGVPTDGEDDAAEGYEKFEISAGQYGVFHHEEGQTMRDLWTDIYCDKIEKSDYVHTGGTELEVWDGDDIVVYVPVEERKIPVLPQRKRGIGPSMCMFIGLALGAVVGSGKDNMAMYLTIGLIAGGAVGFALDKSRSKREEEKRRDEEGFAQTSSRDTDDKTDDKQL